jgi:hypothetical protein
LFTGRGCCRRDNEGKPDVIVFPIFIGFRTDIFGQLNPFETKRLGVKAVVRICGERDLLDKLHICSSGTGPGQLHGALGRPDAKMPKDWLFRRENPGSVSVVPRAAPSRTTTRPAPAEVSGVVEPETKSPPARSNKREVYLLQTLGDTRPIHGKNLKDAGGATFIALHPHQLRTTQTLDKPVVVPFFPTLTKYEDVVEPYLKMLATRGVPVLFVYVVSIPREIYQKAKKAKAGKRVTVTRHYLPTREGADTAMIWAGALAAALRKLYQGAKISFLKWGVLDACVDALCNSASTNPISYKNINNTNLDSTTLVVLLPETDFLPALMANANTAEDAIDALNRGSGSSEVVIVYLAKVPVQFLCLPKITFVTMEDDKRGEIDAHWLARHVEALFTQTIK